MTPFPETEIGEDYYEGSSDYPEPAEFAEQELEAWRGCSWDKTYEDAA